MKKVSISVVLMVMLCALILSLSGCSWCPAPFGSKGCEQLGETKAEGHRRHLRNARINHQQMNSDIDRVMLFDKPVKTTPMRIP